MRIPTDAELADAINRAKVPATMATLACGRIELVKGEHKKGAALDCTEHGTQSAITDALGTFIV